VMGEFTGGPDGRPIEKREPVSINKDNFNEVMKGQNISLQVTVPNRLTGDADDELAVSLAVQAMHDFSPESVLEQVPELKRLLELREALRALKGPLANLPDFGRKIHELVTDSATRAKLLTEIDQQHVAGRRTP
jgi:type VI secretion system protein ImpB